MSAFRILQKAIQGGRKLTDALTLAAQAYEQENVIISGYSPTQFGGDYIKLTDTKATTVQGGASIAGTQTRDLNTEDSDTGNNCTLSSNQFTILSGTYRIIASSPAYRVDRHKLFLYNVTDAADEIIGTSEYATLTSGIDQTRSFIVGQLEITSSTIFEIRHYTELVRATEGLGNATSDGTSEIYTVVELWKVK